MHKHYIGVRPLWIGHFAIHNPDFHGEGTGVVVLDCLPRLWNSGTNTV
jgi:hypothetical protein